MKKIILIILLFLSGCDLFTTRDPAEPENRSQNYNTPTTTDILLSNMKQSFTDGYAEYYIECFVNQTYLNKKFKFIPTAAYQTNSAFGDWGLNEEKQYFNALKSKLKTNTSVSLTFSNQIFSPQGGDSALVTADYRLTFSSNASSFPSDYQGYLQFKVFLDQRNEWVIVEWTDIKKENYNSWSELKGRLY